MATKNTLIMSYVLKKFKSYYQEQSGHKAPKIPLAAAPETTPAGA